MQCLAFDGAGTPTADQIPLNRNEKEQRRNRDHHPGGHDQSPVNQRRVKEVLHPHRQRLQLVRGDEDPREDVVVPGQDEGEDGRGDDPRQGQGQDHVDHRAHPAGTVDQRGLFQLQGDGLEEGPHQPEGEGQTERGESQDQGEVGVLNPHLLRQDEEGDHHHDGSEHIGAQDEPCDLLPA